MVKLLLMLSLSFIAQVQAHLLSPEEAFDFSWQKKGHLYEVQWHIDKDYKLYTHCIIAKENGKEKTIAWQNNPDGDHPKGVIEISSASASLSIEYQGCHKTGLCLPPVHQTLHPPTPWQQTWQAFLLGLLLSITPCLLPLWPIFMTSLQMAKNDKPCRSISLSLAFIAGIVLSYNAMAMALYALHAPLLAWVQNPMVLSIVSLLLLYLGLSMVALLPSFMRFHWQMASPLPKWPNYPHLTLFTLGAGGLMVLSPCLTPPLLAALTYTPTLSNLWLPASSLAMGMSLPFMALALGQKWLMSSLRKITLISQLLLGLFVLMTALLLIGRLVHDTTMLWMWGIYALVTTGLMIQALPSIKKQALLLALPLAIALHQGFNTWQTPTISTLTPIQSVSHLQKALMHNKPTVVMVSATWCGTCKTVKQHLLSALKEQHHWQALIIDASYPPKTADLELIDAWGLHSAPMLLWFDAKGTPLPNQRILGNVGKDEIEKIMKRIEKRES